VSNISSWFAESHVGWLIAGLMLLACSIALLIVVYHFGGLWLQAYMSGSHVSLLNLIGMQLRQVNPESIVRARIMGRQASLTLSDRDWLSTARMEALVLAGGDINQVVQAIIVAHRAGLDLDFDRAAAIQLAGRNVLDAVQTSVSPKLIDCPDPQRSARRSLSAVAKDGVELRVRARVTVRTNLDQLIGGATEDTIVARVGQGIISAIGSTKTHMEVLETPERISKSVLARGLDSNTAFEIVSIDIADIDVGENIGARLQADQADADMRLSQAEAEMRRAEAVAYQHEMRAKVAENRALLVLAEAQVPRGLSHAIRAGQFRAACFPHLFRNSKKV